MISGSIGPTLDAVVPLRLRSDSGREVEVQAVVDTGFNDYLSLPKSVIAELGLIPYDNAKVRLSGDIEVETPLYLLRVLWHDGEKIVSAQEAEGNPLIGMLLLLGSRVTLSVRNGGAVLIEPEA